MLQLDQYFFFMQKNSYKKIIFVYCWGQIKKIKITVYSLFFDCHLTGEPAEKLFAFTLSVNVCLSFATSWIKSPFWITLFFLKQSHTHQCQAGKHNSQFTCELKHRWGSKKRTTKKQPKIARKEECKNTIRQTEQQEIDR